MTKLHKVEKWRSPKYARWNMYQHPNRLVRWYFWRRLEVALELLSEKHTGLAVDIGCGEGILLPSLANIFRTTIGLDLDLKILDVATHEPSAIGERVLVQARELVALECDDESHVSVIAADALALPLPNGEVDAIFCLDAIEHMPDPVQFLGEVQRSLRSGGEFIATMPVEIGPALMIREISARALSFAREPFQRGEFLDGVLGRLDEGRTTNLRTHKGYDYRSDLKLIDTRLRIVDVRYIPFHPVGQVNPTVAVRALKVPV